MNEKILLNDLLQLKMDGSVKIKFNQFNGEENPLEDYLDDPSSEGEWVTWRGMKSDFRVGQIVINCMKMRDGRWLLVSVRKVISDTGIAKSQAYGTVLLEDYRHYMGRVIFINEFKIGKQYIRIYDNCCDGLVVQEVLPRPYSGVPFPGLANIQISLSELKAFEKNKNNEWISPLQSQKGVYLMRDTNTNKLYVGAAYGSDGLWQRWISYIHTDGSGGNVELLKLLKNDPQYGLKYFVFSVLETFSSMADDKTILDREQWWKITLGAELNRN